MTRFIYLSDTHVGATPMGYQRQKGYPEHLPGLLAALLKHPDVLPGLDFILHGGDMVDAATDALIRRAVEWFSLPVPVYLTLGNHDLTRPEAVARWMALAPGFFHDQSPDYSIVTPDVAIHVAPNHWDEASYYWSARQDARLSVSQFDRLDQAIRRYPGRVHMLATHSPVYGVPIGQTGFSEPAHAPQPAFTTQVTDWVGRHTEVKVVLGAHSHINMRRHADGIEYVTTSAFVEAPFEAKLFEVTAHSVAMRTITLGARAGFEPAYDASCVYVQGRPVDRTFTLVNPPFIA